MAHHNFKRGKARQRRVFLLPEGTHRCQSSRIGLSRGLFGLHAWEELTLYIYDLHRTDTDLPIKELDLGPENDQVLFQSQLIENYVFAKIGAEDSFLLWSIENDFCRFLRFDAPGNSYLMGIHNNQAFLEEEHVPDYMDCRLLGPSY